MTFQSLIKLKVAIPSDNEDLKVVFDMTIKKQIIYI